MSTATNPHALADALAVIRAADHDVNAAAQVVTAMNQTELAEMVGTLAALVGIARETGHGMSFDTWAEAVLRASDTPA